MAEWLRRGLQILAPGFDSRSGLQHASDSTRLLKIFFDGGCRPNPGRMEVAAVAGGRLHHRPDIGHGASDEAEWLALLHALDVADALGVRDVILVGDAADVIDQARGRVRCGTANNRHYHDRFVSRAATFDRVRLRHVRRGQNLAGIALDAASRRG